MHHDLQVIANLKASPPSEPVVCLLGGSSARECTISDEVWAAQVQALGATALTYDLGSGRPNVCRRRRLMETLPSGQFHMIVFIGISVGSFIRPQTWRHLPASGNLSSRCRRGTSTGIARAIFCRCRRSAPWRVSGWSTKYPLFQANFSTARMMLERLITVCKSRGLHPVLVETPRNMAIIGHTMDAPIARVREHLSRPEHQVLDPLPGRLRRRGEPGERRLLRPVAHR